MWGRGHGGSRHHTFEVLQDAADGEDGAGHEMDVSPESSGQQPDELTNHICNV